jgi:hypothetical protein
MSSPCSGHWIAAFGELMRLQLMVNTKPDCHGARGSRAHGARAAIAVFALVLAMLLTIHRTIELVDHTQLPSWI